MVLADGTVTGRYSTVILHEASHEPLLEYIRTKNGWTQFTLQCINWEAHASAINRTAIRHTLMVKLLHRLLPTAAQANKFDGGNRRCVLCGSSFLFGTGSVTRLPGTSTGALVLVLCAANGKSLITKSLLGIIQVRLVRQLTGGAGSSRVRQVLGVCDKDKAA